LGPVISRHPDRPGKGQAIVRYCSIGFIRETGVLVGDFGAKIGFIGLAPSELHFWDFAPFFGRLNGCLSAAWKGIAGRAGSALISPTACFPPV
jgi:hypothetical protein